MRNTILTGRRRIDPSSGDFYENLKADLALQVAVNEEVWQAGKRTRYFKEKYWEGGLSTPADDREVWNMFNPGKDGETPPPGYAYWYTREMAEAGHSKGTEQVEVAMAGAGIAKAVVLRAAAAFLAGGALGSAASRTGPAASRVWRLDPFARGVAIENALGRNLPSNFPVIDRFSGGVATSIKSIDLGAASYQNVGVLTRVVAGYIDDVAAFTAQSWAKVTISASQVTGRALELAVPRGTGSVAQRAALQGLVRYGQSVGVRVIIIPF